MSAASERWPTDAGLSPDAMCDVTPTAHYRLERTSQAPRDARAFLTEVACRRHVDPAHVENAALLVSELVTNAIRHASPPLSLTVGCARSWLVVEVGDGSGNLPQERQREQLSEGGRGLPLVSAFASEWGSTPTPTGKVTWFRLRL